MSRFRKIDPRIWNDAGFRQLSDQGKLVFFLLITHPNMTSLGAMRATQPGLAAELEWEPKDFREAFGEAFQQGMIEHDPKAHLIALPNFIRYNAPASPNVVKAWAGAVDLLPECSLKTVTIQRAKDFAEGMGEGFAKAFAEAFGAPSPNKKKEQEKEKDKTPSQGAGLSGKGGVGGQAGRDGLKVVAGGAASAREAGR